METSTIPPAQEASATFQAQRTEKGENYHEIVTARCLLRSILPQDFSHYKKLIEIQENSGPFNFKFELTARPNLIEEDFLDGIHKADSMGDIQLLVIVKKIPYRPKPELETMDGHLIGYVQICSPGEGEKASNIGGYICAHEQGFEHEKEVFGAAIDYALTDLGREEVFLETKRSNFELCYQMKKKLGLGDVTGVTGQGTYWKDQGLNIESMTFRLKKADWEKAIDWRRIYIWSTEKENLLLTEKCSKFQAQLDEAKRSGNYHELPTSPFSGLRIRSCVDMETSLVERIENAKGNLKFEETSTTMPFEGETIEDIKLFVLNRSSTVHTLRSFGEVMGGDLVGYIKIRRPDPSINGASNIAGFIHDDDEGIARSERFEEKAFRAVIDYALRNLKRSEVFLMTEISGKSRLRDLMRLFGIPEQQNSQENKVSYSFGLAEWEKAGARRRAEEAKRA